MLNTMQCQPGVVCTHEGPCNRDCGGDHYFHTNGTCLRCGKFAHEKAVEKPLVPKTRPLKLWNGPWGREGYAYVAAYSQQDAVNLALAAGHPPHGLRGEIENYWHRGAWGVAMTGITPERGIWVSDGRGTPVRQSLDPAFVMQQSTPRVPKDTDALEVERERALLAKEAKARRWRAALVEQIQDQKELIERRENPANSPFHGAPEMGDIGAERLELLERLLEFEPAPDEGNPSPT